MPIQREVLYEHSGAVAQSRKTKASHCNPSLLSTELIMTEPMAPERKFYENKKVNTMGGQKELCLSLLLIYNYCMPNYTQPEWIV